MTVVDVVYPTLVVVATWSCLAGVFAGCGFLTRVALSAGLPRRGSCSLMVGDFWIGLAVMTAYLQLWSLFLAVGSLSWLVPGLVGLAGLVAGVRRSFAVRPARWPIRVVVLVGLGTVWLANQALGAAANYDLGFYHLNVIEYAERYSVIPGLANLAIRLGASDPHLLVAALLDQGPWAGAGTHLVNGLLATMLFVDVGSRVVRRRAGGAGSLFTDRMALLLVPAAILTIGLGPHHWISAPDLDFGAFIVVSVGMLYLAELVERGDDAGSAIVATSALALVSATRPLYWPATLFAIVVVVVQARGRGALERGALGLRRAAVVSVALPAAILVGFVARESVLTGYPLFPLTVGGLPVDWRVPVAAVRSANRIDSAWARWPRVAPAVVLDSWHWLTAWWLPKRKSDLQVLLPLTMLACLAPTLLSRRGHDTDRAQRLWPMLVVLVPSVGTLAIWFMTAPDPRFALAPIWLVPVALAAWSLPGMNVRPPPAFLALVTAAGAALVVTWAIEPAALIPVALVGSTGLYWATAISRPRTTPLWGHAAVLASVTAGFIFIASLGAFHPVVSNGRGPFGVPPEPVPRVRGVETLSGLRLVQPVASDQCWRTILCAPQINSRLRLRGSSIDAGFRSQRREAMRSPAPTHPDGRP
jgi:hypothetical protein